MPFDFLKRKKDGAGADAPIAGVGGSGIRGVPFDGLTDEWRIVGEMHIPARLSDALNKREAVTISDVRWAPVDGSGELAPASGLKAVDPYDLILVLAGAATLPPLTDAERTAYKVHKIPYDVALEVPPYRVIGTVYMTPGSEPDRLLDRATEMFFPVVAATAFLGETSWRTRWTRSSSIGSTCVASSRSTGGPANARSPFPANRSAASPGATARARPASPTGGPGEGAGEHGSERTLRYVSERADPATRAWAVPTATSKRAAAKATTRRSRGERARLGSDGDLLAVE